jgi:hypothetical protein
MVTIRMTAHCPAFVLTITLSVQSQVHERSCVLLPLHYLYKARTMSGHVYCYHYTTCTKAGQWAVMRIVTITLPVQSQDNEPPCVLLSNNTHDRSCTWLCTDSVMVTIHMTAHLPGFVQVV